MTNSLKMVPMVMPPTSTRPMELRAAVPAPVTSTRGEVAGDGGHRGHQHGTQADHGRLMHGFELAHPLPLPPVGQRPEAGTRDRCGLPMAASEAIQPSAAILVIR